MIIINAIKKRLFSVLLAALLCASTFTACTSQNPVADEVPGTSDVSSSGTNATTPDAISAQYDSEDEDSSWNSADATAITLNGESIAVAGDGVTVDASKATITAAGTYSISGTLTNGQIVVNTNDEKTVRLILNKADITCSVSAPIYVTDAKKVVLVLADGTENKITDGASYILDDAEKEEPDAAIFSKCDLTINGSGALTVASNFKNAIASKDSLKITGGNITVNSVADGLRGKDCIAVKNATIAVTAKGDGLKSTNDEDAGKGYIDIEGNSIVVTAGEDAIQAETTVLIGGGDFTLSSGGGSASSINSTIKKEGMQNTAEDTDTVSAKGIKAGVSVTIEGGTIAIDSADDAIHSNDSLTINKGTITISAGDDGIHSDTVMAINGGDILIRKSYEGIESAAITIGGGTISLVSSDDGINVSGGKDGSSTNGRPGQNTFGSSGSNALIINGGYIAVDAAGDGLDANGSITITGGTVIVNGSTSNNNGALDYDGAFNMTGGYLVAAGSSGMAQSPDTSSTQNSVIMTFPTSLAAGTMVHIEAADGKEVLTFVPAKQFQTVVFCSPELKTGTTYHILYGGSSTGTPKDGLYPDASYTPGTQFTDFTISGTVTSAGTSVGTNRGGGGKPMNRP